MNNTTRRNSGCLDQVLVWGAGAIGGTIGGFLDRAGYKVSVVDKEADHIEAIRQNGLRIKGPVDSFTAFPDAFTTADIQGKYEVILLCVKAHHTATAIRQIESHLQPEGFVVSIQNGLNERIIASQIGDTRTVGAFVNLDADYLEPGVIHYGGRGAVVIGELTGEMTPRLASLHRALVEFDRDAIMTDNIWGYLWSKLAYGAMLFATALTDLPVSTVLAISDYQPVFVALVREVFSVSDSQGIVLESFDGFDPEAFKSGIDPQLTQASFEAIIERTGKSAQTHTGIWRDLAVRKRRTEVDAQLGQVIDIAHQEGIPTPLLEQLVSLIHDIEREKLPQTTENMDRLRMSMV